MKRILFFLLVFILHVFESYAADKIAKDADRIIPEKPVILDDSQAAQILGRTPEDSPYQTFQNSAGEQSGLNLPVSIDLSNPNDINWDGVLQVNGADSGPDPVILPFLPSIPIENFEVKFRVLNKKF